MTAQTAARMNYEKVGQKFATVSIPDLRNQQIQMIREEAQAGVPPLTTTDEERLDGIKAAINRSFQGSAVATAQSEASDWLQTAEGEETSQLQPLVDSILEHYPAGGTPIITIVASDENSQLASATGRTAALLQSNSAGRILVIDSDLENGGLTYNMNCVGRAGLIELIADRASWNESVSHTSNPNIDFLSIGRTTLRQATDIGSWICKSLPLFKHDYEYVLVCAGDAHSTHGTQWCSNSNGAYLLVSMSASNQTIAKSAVTQLQTHGTKLLGCVITDSQ